MTKPARKHRVPMLAAITCLICSQVLEHIKNYHETILNLMSLADSKLIITVPYAKSFLDPSHVNFWDDDGKKFDSIHNLIRLFHPLRAEVRKIVTKPEDEKTGARLYLITIGRGFVWEA